MPATDRSHRTQAEVLAAIRELMKQDNVPPTYREVAAFLGWKSHSRVFSAVQQLRKEGLVYDPEDGRSRTLVPVDRSDFTEAQQKRVHS